MLHQHLLLSLKHLAENDCPSGFVGYQNNCYKFSNNKETWSDARAVCQGLSDDYDLVVIGNMELNNFVAQQGGSNDYWIGFSDTSAEGSFQWIDGSVPTLANWNPGEPNNIVRHSLILICFVY